MLIINPIHQSKICEAVECYEAATEVIAVPVGKSGTIALNLCNKCAITKFQATINPTRYFKTAQLRNDKVADNRTDDNNSDITKSEQAKRKPHNKYPQAIRCSICGQFVIAELEGRSVTLYDFKSHSTDQGVVHEHPADAITIARVIDRVTTEIRLLETEDPDDYYYVGESERNYDIN